MGKTNLILKVLLSHLICYRKVEYAHSLLAKEIIILFIIYSKEQLNKCCKAFTYLIQLLAIIILIKEIHTKLIGMILNNLRKLIVILKKWDLVFNKVQEYGR